VAKPTNEHRAGVGNRQ